MKSFIQGVFLGILLAGALPTFALDTSVFLQKAEIKGDGDGINFAALTIPQRLFSETSADFADLRVVDDKGIETPFVIIQQTKPGEYEKSFSFKIASYSQGTDTEEVLLERPDAPSSCRELDFHISGSDFNKNVTIQTSSYQGTWETLTSDAIFDFSSKVNLRKTSIKFNETDAKFFKLIIRDSTGDGPAGKQINLKYDGLDFSVSEGKNKSFRINSVSGRGGNTRARSNLIDTATLKFSIEETLSKKTATNLGITNLDKKTVIDLGLVNLPINEITFQINNPFYYRQIDFFAGQIASDRFSLSNSGTVYRFPGMSRSENTIHLDGQRRKLIQLVVQNADNPPLDLSKIDVSWVRHSLYFIPQKDRKYSLYFGGGFAKKPNYDLSLVFPSMDKLQACPEWTMADIVKNDVFVQPDPVGQKEKNEQAIFTIIILIVVALLSYWIFSLMKQIPTEPTKPA